MKNYDNMIEGPNLSDLKLDDTNYRACMQDTIQLIINVFWMSINISSVVEFQRCTANVYRDLQGLCGEIGVRGFQIYGDCMYTRNPCNFEISTL